MLERAWSDSLRHELDLFGKLLGAVRDLDVLIEHLDDRGERARRRTQRHRGAARAAPIGARSSARTRLREATGRPAILPPARPSRKRSQSAAGNPSRPAPSNSSPGREFKKLRSLERRTSRTDDRQLHKLRIQGKRARYAAELAQSSRGAPAARFVKDSTKLQDVLGEHQDAVVALDRLRRLAKGSRLDRRRIHSRTDRGARGADASCGRDSDLPSAWKRVRNRGKAAW